MQAALVLTPELIEHLYGALERAWCKGREGPYGLYDYSDYGWATPHHVRDFRDPNSATWGECAFKSTDRGEAEAEYERLTREHLITSVIGAYEGVRVATAKAQESELRKEAPPGTPQEVWDLALVLAEACGLKGYEWVGKRGWSFTVDWDALSRAALAAGYSKASADGSAKPVAWSLVFSEALGVNAETTFKTREQAQGYASRCSSPPPRVVPLYAAASAVDPTAPTVLDVAWDNINVLGAPDTACRTPEDLAYCRGIYDALVEIDKLRCPRCAAQKSVGSSNPRG